MTPFLQRRVFDLPRPGPIYLIPNEPGTQFPVNPGNTLLGARMPILWTVKDIVQQLQLKPSTVYAWAAQGKIPSLKIHGLIRFRADQITQWIESFSRPSGSRTKPHVRPNRSGAHLDVIIARIKKHAYNPRHGETRQRSSPIGKEAADGAV
jgi:excisionase family DNA binding protein